MTRYSGLAVVLLVCGGLLLLITVTVGPLAGGRGHPTELLPANDAPPLHEAAPLSFGPDAATAQFYRTDIEGPAPEPRADAEELTTLDLSGFTPARLERLDGRRLRFRVITDSGVWRVGDRDVFEAVMRDARDDLATVWMYANPDIEDGMTVEGQLRVVHHPAISVGATTVKAFTEYRLVDAVRVGS